MEKQGEMLGAGQSYISSFLGYLGISKDRALQTHVVLCIVRSTHDMMLVRSSRKKILKALQGRLLLHRAEGGKKSLSSHVVCPCDVKATSSRKKAKTNNRGNKTNGGRLHLLLA